MKILIVSPHPDDESLGAGGTLIKLKKSGHKIYWLNITDVKEEYGFSTEFIKKRSEHIKNIINFYKFDGFFNFQLQPAGLSNLDEGIIISKIRKVFDEVKPEGMKSMGLIMKQLNAKITNADMSLVSKLVKDRLSN